MIHKTTKIIFEDREHPRTEEMLGGIPLTKGETVTVHNDGMQIQYEVADKRINCFLKGQDQTVDITYILRKKE